MLPPFSLFNQSVTKKSLLLAEELLKYSKEAKKTYPVALI